MLLILLVPVEGSGGGRPPYPRDMREVRRRISTPDVSHDYFFDATGVKRISNSPIFQSIELKLRSLEARGQVLLASFPIGPS